MERSNIPYKTYNVIYKTLGYYSEKAFPIAKATSVEDAVEQFWRLNVNAGNINLSIVSVELAA